MIIITLARKPLASGSVAANVLEHEAGALNIDASRISTNDNLNGGAYSIEGSERHDGAENWRMKRGEHGGLAGKEFQQPSGRWPSNLILNHLAECKFLGIAQVKGVDGDDPSAPYIPNMKNTVFGVGMGGGKRPKHSDKNGMETVEDWDCAPGCPVLDLDRQSGVSVSNVRQGGEGEPPDPSQEGWRFLRISGGFKDEGGASRYFKQVGGRRR